MTFRFNLSERNLQAQFRPAFQKMEADIRRKVLFAMGSEFKRIVIGNFATHGSFSPTPWAPLSKRYQKRMARTDQRTPTYVGSQATLFRSGKLFRSVKLTVSDTKAVISEGEGLSYAETHQFGLNGVPARPTFPIHGNFAAGVLTPFAEKKMIEAAEKALSK